MQLQEMAADALSGHRTTPALVADVLREAILTGVLPPGQPVRQEEVAARFGLSRSPIREALRQLEGEGLVKLYPNRGAVVVGVTLGELRELVEIRVSLETLAIRLALPLLTDRDLRRLDEIIAEADAMTDEEARQRWGANNWDFHSTLYAPARRPRLFAMIKNLHMHVDRYVRVYFALAHASERAQTDHRGIVAACRNRDVERVTFLIERDIEGVVEMLARVLPEDTANLDLRQPARPAIGGRVMGSGDASD
ncbi:MAG TPA: GntR family transcriptional regulator [Chloroflexota bacterium]|nr:GntR family transcriptional regulator [Chloroflexota bacterium]